MSQTPQAENDKQVAEGAPATVTPSKKPTMREALASMKEYSPKAASPATSSTPSYSEYKPSNAGHAPAHVPPQQSNQAFIGAAPGYRLVPPGYYYSGAPYQYMGPPIVYQGGYVNPMGMHPQMAHPGHAQQHLPHHPSQGPHHHNAGTASGASGTSSPTTSPTSTTGNEAASPTASTVAPSTSPSTNASAMIGYAATAGAYTPSTAAATTSPAANGSGNASPASASTNVTAASLAVPAKDAKSTLASSGETPNLQPPIRKNTGKSTAATPASTASPVSTPPASNGTSSPAPEASAAQAAAVSTDAAKATTEKTQSPAISTTPTPVETSKVSEEKPVAAASATKAEPAADVKVKEEKKPANTNGISSPAPTAPTAAPAASTTTSSTATKTESPKITSLKDSFEPNFEVEEPSPRKDATPASTPASTTAAPASTASSSTSSSATTSSAPSTASTPSTPADKPFVPSYRFNAAALAEQAKKNDSVSGPPPGALRTYSPDLLLSLMKAAKEAPAPHALQLALQKTTINSPGGRTGGKAGGGGKGGRSARGDKGASKGPPPTAVRPQVEAGSIEEKSRKFRGILNKITPETFDRLVASMLAIPIENLETLVALVDIIVDTAVRELKFCSMYANLCSDIAMRLPEFEVEGAGKKNFRVIILTRCQDLFSKRQSVAPVPAEITDPEQKQEWEFKQNKIRNNMLGLVKFVGELANTSVLATSIIPRILDELLKAKFGYDDLELFTILLSTSGKRFPESPKYVKDCRDWVTSFAARDKDQQDSEGTRIRYLMQDVIDLADNNWVPRSASSAAQGPKTLDEIRADIARKEKLLENELKNIAKQRGRLAQPVPTKTPSRGPAYSIMQRDQAKDTPPRTPSSPSQGGRGKAGFASQTPGAFSPARGTTITPQTSQGLLASPSTLSNAFASLSMNDFDPNYLTASTSSAPADDEDIDMMDEDNAEAAGPFDPSELDESLEEFLDSNVGEEVVEILADCGNVEEACKYFVSKLLLKVLDLTQDTKRNWAVGLLSLFIKEDSGLADTEKTVVPGLIQTLSELDSIDMPRAPTFMGNILSECIKRKLFPINCLNKVLSPLASDDSNPTRTTNVIVAMWSGIPASELPTLIKQSNFNISNWPIPDEKVPPAMKQVFETAESQIARGEDLFTVAFWAKANSPATLKNSDFILKVLQKLIDEVKEGSKPNLLEDENTKSIVAILASSPGPMQKTIAQKLCDAFRATKSVQAGMNLFTLFVNAGFPRKQLTDAADSIDSILYAPAYAVWLKATESAAGSSSGGKASSSKGGKSKGGKKKGK